MSVKIWQDSRSDIDIDSIKKNNEDYILLNQKHINYINNYLKSFVINKKEYKIFEPWSWFWAGSYFLSKKNNNFKMTLLDYDDKLINNLQEVYKGNNQFSLKYWDMFNIDLPNESFDFIYNAWVIEHFNYKQRLNIFKEYSKVLKKWWYMFIVIPNHYNLIYKLFYLTANILWKWKVAKEYSIYSLKKECSLLGLEFVERKTFIENSVYWMLTLLIIKK